MKSPQISTNVITYICVLNIRGLTRTHVSEFGLKYMCLMPLLYLQYYIPCVDIYITFIIHVYNIIYNTVIVVNDCVIDELFVGMNVVNDGVFGELFAC